MPRAATTSDAFNAVAEPRRRDILNYLALQERPVGDIVASLGLEQPSISKHLRVLKDVGLVRVRREGRQMLYRINAEAIRPLHEWRSSVTAETLPRVSMTSMLCSLAFSFATKAGMNCEPLGPLSLMRDEASRDFISKV
jgi:DNA-binding transcriptional ArsR family regulator